MKRTRGGREYSDLQKFKAENKKLKKEVSRLRKIIQKMENEHAMVGIMELVEAQRKEDRELYETKKRIDTTSRWVCFKCDVGTLILTIFSRMDGVFYYRRCHACGNRTRMKKYHDNVKGVKNEDLANNGD